MPANYAPPQNIQPFSLENRVNPTVVNQIVNKTTA